MSGRGGGAEAAHGRGVRGGAWNASVTDNVTDNVADNVTDNVTDIRDDIADGGWRDAADTDEAGRGGRGVESGG